MAANSVDALVSSYESDDDSEQTSTNLSTNGNIEDFPVIWDTGASRSVSPSKDDFKGAIRPSLANGLEVCGEGEVKWTIMADNGLPFTLEHTA